MQGLPRVGGRWSLESVSLALSQRDVSQIELPRRRVIVRYLHEDVIDSQELENALEGKFTKFTPRIHWCKNLEGSRWLISGLLNNASTVRIVEGKEIRYRLLATKPDGRGGQREKCQSRRLRQLRGFEIWCEWCEEVCCEDPS